jgi:hypothetical protein
MILQEAEEVFALDEIQLAGLTGFGCDLVGGIGDGGVKSEHFAGLNDFEDEGFAVAGGGGKFHSPLAQHIDAARSLTFHKQYRSGWICGGKFQFLKGFQRCFREAAEEAVGTELTYQAVLN